MSLYIFLSLLILMFSLVVAKEGEVTFIYKGF